MKKAVKWLVFIIVLAGVCCGGWYLGKKYFDKEQSTEEKETKKEEEKTSGIKIEYKTEKYEKQTENGEIKISNSMRRPVSVSSDNGSKIVKYMDKILDEYWDNVKENTDDKIAEFDPDFQFDDEYGVNYNVSHYINNGVIEMTIEVDGYMGGVMWNQTEFYNFNIDTGEVLTLKDICENVKDCKRFIEDYFLKVLQKDERFYELEEDYEEKVEENIFEVGHFGFSKDGFQVIVPQFEMADGAAGEFIYFIPYEYLNEYLKDEYKM